MVPLAFQIVEPTQGAAQTSGPSLSRSVPTPEKYPGHVSWDRAGPVYDWYGKEAVLVAREPHRAVVALVKTTAFTAPSGTTSPLSVPRVVVPHPAIGVMRICRGGRVPRPVGIPFDFRCGSGRCKTRCRTCFDGIRHALPCGRAGHDVVLPGAIASIRKKQGSNDHRSPPRGATIIPLGPQEEKGLL